MDLSKRHRIYQPRSASWKRRGSRRPRASFLSLLWNIFYSIGKIVFILIGRVFSFVFRFRRSALPFVLLAGAGGLAFFLYILWTLPDPTVIVQRHVTQSTKIYDRAHKTILYDFHEEVKRTNVSLEEIPTWVKHAAIAIEDKDFYRHQGFDLRGVARAILKDVFTLSKAQGGSTLTQQLVKNALLNNQKTFTRKLRELLLAYEIEQRFSKDQILKMYFNEIPYGKLAYGVEAAAQTYFNKSAKDLTIAEGALLAGLVKAPSYYSPYGSRRDELIARSHIVLTLMREQGYITPDQEESAKKEQLKFNTNKEAITAPHFVFFVRDQLEKEFGSDVLDQGGLKVITTLDIEKQKIAEEAVAHGGAKFERYGATNAALVSIDARTGQILAMVGSKDYFDDAIDGKVNVATRERQPGSSFKPVVYAAAFEKGYTPDTLLYDVVTTFKNYPQDYTPQNYTGKTYGLVTIRQALAGSLNIPAVKTLYLTGVERVLDFAERLGYTTLNDRSRFGLSLVLGGGEVTLLEHTAAYAAFAQEGVVRPPTGILRVEDSNGTVLKEFENQSKKIIDAQVVRILTNIMSDNAARTFIFGANNLLTLPDRAVAAKSGTTNDNRDAWLMGFTPSLATGVWVGNNNNKEMKKGADGSVVAAPIWNEYMRRALSKSPVEQFTPPDPINTDKLILNGKQPTITVRVNRSNGKLATDKTPPELIEERVFPQVHSILFWVDKDNPLGPAPTNPEADPQFTNWETAVQTAVEIGPKPPTEQDDSLSTIPAPATSTPPASTTGQSVFSPAPNPPSPTVSQ